MPHVIVKLWPGKTEQQKKRLAERITGDVMDALGYGEESERQPQPRRRRLSFRIVGRAGRLARVPEAQPHSLPGQARDVMGFNFGPTACILTVALLLLPAGCASTTHRPSRAEAPARAEMWVDCARAEPVAFPDMIEDLKAARVVYLGEIHTIPRHHELQAQIFDSLAGQGVRLVLAMEQFEYSAQPALDRYNAGAIDLEGLIRETDWDRRWPDHAGYHALLTAARARGIPVLALNARSETIRAVSRDGGLTRLPAEQRKELPASIVTDDPIYQRLLNKILSVHMAMDPAQLQPVFEAQVARDETMASRLAGFLNSSEGRGRTALVICGRGHCEFGLGVPARVARRMPGISQRIVLFSESGDLHLTEEERRQARDIQVSHEFLQGLGRPVADYLQVTAPAR